MIIQEYKKQFYKIYENIHKTMTFLGLSAVVMFGVIKIFFGGIIS